MFDVQEGGMIMKPNARSMTRRIIPCAVLLFTLFSACNLSTESGPAVVEESNLHVRPSWSPDGKTIAFTSMLQSALGVYLVDSSGTNLRRLVEGEGVGITWSPDGKWLCFSRVSNLYKIKANGDSLARLNTYAGSIRPAWSPDGRRIAFVQRDPADISGIWLFDFRTETASQFVTFGDYPSWHPSGNEIVVLDAQLDRGSGGLIYRFLGIDITTIALRTIAAFSSIADCGFSSISPQGTAIVYGLKPERDRAQIWIFEIGGNRHVRLTDDGGDYPAWSPDGKMIVYTRTTAGDGGLWIMNADGSGKRKLTNS